jgi:hypothetical protein
MNQLTQIPDITTNNLAVTRDGAVDNSYYTAQARRQAIKLILSHTRVAGRALWQPFDNLGYNLSNELRLAVFDALHNTNYRARYHQRLEQRHIERFEAKMSLRTQLQ